MTLSLDFTTLFKFTSKHLACFEEIYRVLVHLLATVMVIGPNHKNGNQNTQRGIKHMEWADREKIV